ncbi:uncharacterized protein LOC116162349 [Photinus pyralis]|uniref:uncharacterized protein LOC116162349 n=1 Tax=Photinus pyralis TaxID=7054 RepID=UPI001266F124|nr:uncharacterized protein LOC116162349 [Photinus pyralis]
MMLQYSNEQLATIIGVPIVTILLIWTVAIFHKNRKKWSSYDIAIVAVLVQSILRNLAILAYTALIIVKNSSIPADYCKAVVWIFNSIHTFQASSLTTLAVIALFTVRLYRKQQSLQMYLTATHVIYHLFCLTTLCACVGVASILAQEDKKNISFNLQPSVSDVACKFMPFDLDVKFNIFIIVLHIFLAMVSLTAFIFICFNHLKMRHQGFDYLKKSTSDLSELSLSLTASVNENLTKNYYDTYTIQRLPHNFDVSYDSQVQNREPMWNSDLSNISMTDEEESGTGLYTMYPILTVCYLFNHIPLINYVAILLSQVRQVSGCCEDVGDYALDRESIALRVLKRSAKKEDSMALLKNCQESVEGCKDFGRESCTGDPRREGGNSINNKHTKCFRVVNFSHSQHRYDNNYD